MANLERRNKVWYARFKDSSGKWKYKSCGKGVLKPEAILIASKWEEEARQKSIELTPMSKQ